MRISILLLLVLLSGCEAVVSFDRSKIDGGAKSLVLDEPVLDAGIDEPIDDDAAAR